MKCERCGKEASVKDITVLKGGVVKEINLCEECAGKTGKVAKPFQSVEQLLQQAIVQQVGAQSRAAASASQCAVCHLTWAQFRERGLLGCPNCYTAFESQLGTLVERAHEGGTHHVGKVPRRARDRVDLTVRVQHLRKQLAEALAAEQYERAAELRDQLTGLGGSSPRPSSPEREGR